MTRLEQLKNKRRMQRRIRQVVEERRMAQTLDEDAPPDATDPEAPSEVPQTG